jgi:MFS family permease
VTSVAPDPLARRILILASALILTDTMFFNAVTPLLPKYADDYGLSKAGAGLLSAMYPLGTFSFALVAGIIASRWGVKPVTLLGLGGIAVTSVVFGFATSILMLDVSRFVQGASGSFLWTGALTWLVSAAPADRRGQYIGFALGAAIGGSMLGPILGGLASATGTGPAFSVVAVVAATLGTIVVFNRAAPAPRVQSLRLLARATRDRGIRLGFWFVLLPALATGTLFVLAPLRLDDLGVGGFGIGACFLVAAVCEGIMSPLLGRLSDRRGRALPLRVGLLGTTVLFAALSWPGNAWLLALLVVLTAMAVGMFWTPGFSLLTDASDAFGLDYALAFALMSLAWAPGQAIGSALSGGLAGATSDAVPYLAVATVSFATLLVVRTRLPRPAKDALAVTAPLP